MVSLACVYARSLQSCLTVMLWMLAHQASLFMGFSRDEYWSGFHWQILPNIEGFTISFKNYKSKRQHLNSFYEVIIILIQKSDKHNTKKKIIDQYPS